MDKDKCQITGKRKFKSEREAKDALRYLIYEKKLDKELRVYFCDYCKTYHFTSTKPIQENEKQKFKKNYRPKKKRSRGSIRRE